jgi:glucokinase
MKNKYVVGIDIGGTYTKVGVVDDIGNCLSKATLNTIKYDRVENFIDALSRLIYKLFADLSMGNDIKGIGIGAPNGNYFKGTIEYAPNLNWKGIIPLVDLMKPYFDVPIILTNDANAAAMGEMIYGAAKGLKDFILITLGTGLGSGIVVNGELVYGHDGFAGEIGHTIIVINGRPCGCGRRGCLETYCSATGITNTFKELLKKQKIKPLIEDALIDAKYINELAKKGDAVAIEAFNYTGEILGIGLANSVAYTSPEAIYLFGGLANAKELLFEPTIRSFNENVMNIYKGKTKILPSGLNGGDVAILGAASLIH